MVLELGLGLGLNRQCCGVDRYVGELARGDELVHDLLGSVVRDRVRVKDRVRVRVRVRIRVKG